MVGLDNLRGLFQPMILGSYDSVIMNMYVPFLKLIILSCSLNKIRTQCHILGGICSSYHEVGLRNTVKAN